MSASNFSDYMLDVGLLNHKLRKSIDKMVKDYAIAVEGLTEQQTTEVIVQMAKSGDFMRHVTQDGQSQQVVYLPYRESVRLKGRVQELERLLALHNIKLPEQDENN